jgi:hypothetical protein
MLLLGLAMCHIESWSTHCDNSAWNERREAAPHTHTLHTSTIPSNPQLNCHTGLGWGRYAVAVCTAFAGEMQPLGQYERYRSHSGLISDLRRRKSAEEANKWEEVGSVG